MEKTSDYFHPENSGATTTATKEVLLSFVFSTLTQRGDRISKMDVATSNTSTEGQLALEDRRNRSKTALRWAALFLGELRDGLTMINMQSAFLIVSKKYSEKQVGELNTFGSDMICDFFNWIRGSENATADHFPSTLQGCFSLHSACLSSFSR